MEKDVREEVILEMVGGGCGNPQLGKADPTKPLPWVSDLGGQGLYQLTVCPDCGGYYVAECPCWVRPGGRYAAPLAKGER